MNSNDTTRIYYWEVVIDHCNNDRTGLVIGLTSDQSNCYFKTDIGIGMSAYVFIFLILIG